MRKVFAPLKHFCLDLPDVSIEQFAAAFRELRYIKKNWGHFRLWSVEANTRGRGVQGRRQSGIDAELERGVIREPFTKGKEIN